MFLVGHDHHQQVAEIRVPEIRRGASVSALATAMVLQPFTDATEGQLGLVGPNAVKIGGVLPYRGQLFLSAYVYYDGTGGQSLSHFVTGPNLAVHGDLKGPYKVGTVGAGFVSGYFGIVPESWVTALGGPVLNGNCCLGVISRTSYGPAVFSIDPLAIGGKVNPVPATPLIYYPSQHPLLEPGASGDGWSNNSTLLQRLDVDHRSSISRGHAQRVVLWASTAPRSATGPAPPTRSSPAQPADGGVDRWCLRPDGRLEGYARVSIRVPGVGLRRERSRRGQGQEEGPVVGSAVCDVGARTALLRRERTTDGRHLRPEERPDLCVPGLWRRRNAGHTRIEAGDPVMALTFPAARWPATQ